MNALRAFLNKNRPTLLLGLILLVFAVLIGVVIDYGLSVNPRTPVPRSRVASEELMVALVFGQSNATNSGEVRYASQENVYNFYRGKFYRARDPLLGATDRGGSVWTRLGDQLIKQGCYKTVVFVPVGVGATDIARWTLRGDLHPRILSAIADVKDSGLEFTHLLWHQGESDAARTSTAAYQARFRNMLASIRAHGVSAPIFVSAATRCYGQLPDKTVRRAQRDLVDVAKNIYAGPDTDTLGPRYRFDGCHFSAEGLALAADLWLQALVLE